MWKSSLIFAVLIVFAGLPQIGQADDPAVAAAYGRGVHAYYAGNYQQSHDTLSQVIGLETDDPRVYYFRGLAALRLGRRDEAVADFSAGADLETAGWSIRTVSRSLERVQGPDRLLLERSRMRARLAVAQRSPGAAATRSAAADLSGPRYSGIGGGIPTATGRSRPEDNPPPTAPAVVPEPAVVQPPPAKPAAPAVPQTPKKPTVRANPFGDDPFADDPFGPDMGTSRRGRSDTQRDQIDAQNELRDAEATDVLDQREAMAERDAAAGDR